MLAVHNLASQRIGFGQTLLGKRASVPSGKVKDMNTLTQLGVASFELKKVFHLMVFPFEGSW